MNSLLIMVDLIPGGKSPHGDKELMTDLFKIVKHQEDSLFNGIKQGAFDILKLTKFFLANKVTHKRVNFDRPVNPDLNVLLLGGDEVFRQVLEGDEIVE